MIDYRQLVHSPAELAAEHVAWAKHLKDAPGIPFGIPAVDAKVIPFHPGDMVVFVARPGHGKTSFLAYLARGKGFANEDSIAAGTLLRGDQLTFDCTEDARLILAHLKD